MSILIDTGNNNERYLVMSELYNLGPVEVNYSGQIRNAPIIITITAAKGNVYNPVIYNSITKEKIMIDTSKLPDAEEKYKLTSDTEIITGKKYYTRTGTAGSYTYTEVTSPVVAQISTYYEQYKVGYFKLGDVVEISTETGNIYVTLTRDSEKTNILNCITNDSSWLTLTSGANYFNYDSRSSYADPPPEDLVDTHNNLSITISADIIYEGV